MQVRAGTAKTRIDCRCILGGSKVRFHMARRRYAVCARHSGEDNSSDVGSFMRGWELLKTCW